MMEGDKNSTLSWREHGVTQDPSGKRHDLEKVAIVTGAGSGIGRAVALALQSTGYSVVLAGRRIARLEQTIAMAAQPGGKMLAVPTDVSQPISFRAFLGRIHVEFGVREF